MRTLLLISIAYLIGSIPFGYLIVRARHGADIRETGSGGTGATNVSRRAGKIAGVLTLLLDALKGCVAVMIAKLSLTVSTFAVVGGLESRTSWLAAAAAIAVIVGHIFPVWLRFRGGKGVATGVGVFLVIAPIAVGFAAVAFLAVVLLTRYVSLGSLLAAASIPIVLLIQHAMFQPIEPFAPTMTAAIAGSALIAFAHRANIERLMAGNESKFK